jgi:hypothetical protein
MSFCRKAPRSKTKITIGSPTAEQGWPAARGGRTPASKRLGWGLDSPSGVWRGWLGGNRLRRWSAARETADGRGGRNSGELAGRPTNACARERPGVCVEAKVELGLKQRRWLAGRTGELGAAATADAGERRGETPEQSEGGGVAWGVGGA